MCEIVNVEEHKKIMTYRHSDMMTCIFLLGCVTLDLVLWFHAIPQHDFVVGCVRKAQAQKEGHVDGGAVILGEGDHD